MIYEMRRKQEPALLSTQWIYNLTHHIYMVWEELAFDDALSYTKWGNGLQHRYMLWQWPVFVPLSEGHQPSALTNWAISPPWTDAVSHLGKSHLQSDKTIVLTCFLFYVIFAFAYRIPCITRRGGWIVRVLVSRVGDHGFKPMVESNEWLIKLMLVTS